MRLRTLTIAATATLTLTAGFTTGSLAAPAAKGRPAPPKVPTSTGYGGAVTSVDPEATAIGLEILRRGGNATDAAVATAAALGVTEPYSAGIGGGGYFVHYDAKTGKVETIDGRETAPAAMPPDAFIDPETGEPYPFSPERVTSGVSVGVPGTLATWERALERWGSKRLDQVLRPGIRLAQKGFVVDETFRQQTLDNKQRFEAFPASVDLLLPRGDAPKVGSVFRNPELADTYRLIAREGTDVFYNGVLADEIADNVQHPRTSPDTDLPVPPGYLTADDMADYGTVDRAPTHVDYRGYDVYGMPPSSSGGSTVGEALNILEQFDPSAMDDVQALHHYLEASALAFADRGKYLGDPAFEDVPLQQLLSDEFAATRACEIDPDKAAVKPVEPGDVDDPDGDCAGDSTQPEGDTEGLSTTNLTVADKWGNIVEYTLTIEQTGGSGMVLPGRGFLLNNELTDFSAVPSEDDPNSVEGGKRPRSSISPTIVLRDGEPFVALGTPGGSTIITTVLQMLVNRIDLGMDIEQAIAAPRAAQRNTADVSTEQAFVDRYGAALGALGHTFATPAEIGAATAIEFKPDGSMVAVAEPERRGGGSAAVLRPTR